MEKSAEYYNKSGLRLISAGDIPSAIEFFTKAIELDPDFPDAYRNRGQLLLEMDRIVEGNADIQKAKDLLTGRRKEKLYGKNGTGEKGQQVRLNWQEVDDLHHAYTDFEDLEEEGEDGNYDYRYDPGSFHVDSVEAEEVQGGFVEPGHTPLECQVVLELVNGKRLTVDRARLFTPTRNDISLIRHDGHVERVIPLQYITSIQLAGIPQELDGVEPSSCQVERIEMAGGKTYNIAVSPEQENENVLFGYETREQGRSVYKLIPVVNIQMRCQNRYLGEILQEKGFIGDDSLKSALDEYEQAKQVQLGSIIAQNTEVALSAIEKELKRARRSKSRKGLKTGEILLASGLVDDEQILDALEKQEHLQNMKIGEFLVEKGLVQEEEVSIALAEKFRIPFIDLTTVKVPMSTLVSLPKQFVQANGILPVEFDGEVITVAISHPEAVSIKEQIIRESKCREVRFVLALPTHLRIIIEQLGKIPTSSEPE